MNNIKQISRLMVFSEVAQKGSFTQAANVLGTSKSAVSQQIKLLEAEIGMHLLNRTTRGVSVTPLGEKLLLRCRLLQDQLDLVFTDIVNAGASPTGRFAVTFPHTLDKYVVMPAIEQLCLEFPGLQPELIATERELDLVEHNLDVAIHAGPLKDSGYRAQPVGLMKEIFCATPLFLNKNKRPANLQQLQQTKWIANSWQNRNAKIYVAGEQQSVKLNQIAKANTLPGALRMALAHMGMILLPDLEANPLIKSGYLIHILEDVVGPSWEINTVHPYSAKKPVHISRFHQLICRNFEHHTNI